jgi:hypothetical protein
MEHTPRTSVQIDPDRLGKMIEECESASSSMIQILGALQVSGQTSQEWASDPVSLDVADHYTLQLWAGANCTYASLKNYHRNLLSVIDALRRTFTEYQTSDETAADSLEQL